MDSCKDCIHVKNITEKLETHEEIVRENTKRLNKLERRVDVSDEKLNQIYTLLGELKISIDGIKKSIEEKNDRLPKFVYAVAGTALGSIISGVVVWLVIR